MIIPVALALVCHRDCYLVGQRGPGGPLAGYFEFPGGKCQAGESLAACAVRECWEETGMQVEVIRLRRQLEYTYAHGTVDLNFFDCRLLAPNNPEQVRAAFRWIPRHELPHFQFPEPNRELLIELAGSAVL